jgi:hypothetical protein
MAKAMHNVVLRQMKVVLQQNKFISISCDEITIINSVWIFVHAYVVAKLEKATIFFES